MILRFYNKKRTVISIVRGLVFKYLFLPFKDGKKLRIGKNVIIKGNIKIGYGVNIESNVKIYNNTYLGNQVIIGDNVELRSNGISKVRIGDKTSINRNSMVMGLVTIKENCAIAPGCIIVGSNHVFDDVHVDIKKQGLSRKGISIERNVWLGANVVVLDGVRIGEGSVIGAGSIVTKSIPAFSIAVGNPCKVVKSRV